MRWRLCMKSKIWLIWLAVGMVVLVAFAAIAVRAFLYARTAPSQSSCINLLRQIDGAKQRWAMEKNKTTNDVPTWEDILPYLIKGESCPQGGTYTLGRVGDLPTCSVASHKLPPRE